MKSPTRLFVLVAAILCALVFAFYAIKNDSTPQTGNETAQQGAKDGSTAKGLSDSTKAGDAAIPADISPENILYLDTNYGRVVIRMRPDIAPKHVERIKTLTRQGFYNGLKFHRVLDGFMAQTGDPQGTGRGGSNLPDLKEEFNPRPFERGVVGMARSSDPDSANSQFFIMFGRAAWLNGLYTAWGEVQSGMEFIDKLEKGEPPQSPDVIIKMQIAADVERDNEKTQTKAEDATQ